jgi:hypothetical protein
LVPAILTWTNRPRPAMPLVLYNVQGDEGDDAAHPNYFRAALPASPVLRDLVEQFPLARHATFHYRFKMAADNINGNNGGGAADGGGSSSSSSSDKGAYVWKDVVSPSARVPSFDGLIWAKVLQTSTAPTTEFTSPASPRAAAPAPAAPARQPAQQQAKPSQQARPAPAAPRPVRPNKSTHSSSRRVLLSLCVRAVWWCRVSEAAPPPQSGPPPPIQGQGDWSLPSSRRFQRFCLTPRCSPGA